MQYSPKTNFISISVDQEETYRMEGIARWFISVSNASDIVENSINFHFSFDLVQTDLFSQHPEEH